MSRTVWLLTLALVASSAGAQQAADLAAPALPDDPLAGRLFFENKQCNRCHDIAKGGLTLAPELGGAHHFSGSFLDMGAALWNHVPGMSANFDAVRLPWPELSERETVEIVAFLYFIEYLGRPGDAEAGQKVFVEGGCAACHSLGDNTADVGPDLSELDRFASPLYVAQAIWNHGPSMFASMRRRGMAPPTFAEGDLADLSAYIRQQAPPGPRERMLLAPGNPNRGQELFNSKGCSTCHGKDARSGDEGPDLGVADLHRSAEGVAGRMWNHALVMSDTMRARGIGWPSLTTSELADLVAFLYFLPFTDVTGDATSGAAVFEEHGCASCHNADQATVHAGPELRGTGLADSPESLVAKMWNHAPLMKKAILAEGQPWPELSGEDLRNLYTYLASTP